MTAENKRIPEWAREERGHDLAWIQENLDIFYLAAGVAYEDAGRGAIVVDTTVQPVEGLGHPFGYFAQEQIEEYDDEGTKRIVQEYDPDQEFVLVLLKAENRTSTYRIRSQPADQGRTDRE